MRKFRKILYCFIALFFIVFNEMFTTYKYEIKSNHGISILEPDYEIFVYDSKTYMKKEFMYELIYDENRFEKAIKRDYFKIIQTEDAKELYNNFLNNVREEGKIKISNYVNKYNIFAEDNINYYVYEKKYGQKNIFMLIGDPQNNCIYYFRCY